MLQLYVTPAVFALFVFAVKSRNLLMVNN